MQIRVFDDLDSLSHGAAEFFVLKAKESIRISSQFKVALSGGSTPKRLYELLSQEPYRDYIDWNAVFVFFGDERFVPETHPESNEYSARNSLLEKVPIPGDQIFGMYQPHSTPASAAIAYEQKLKLLAPGGMDLALLGIGDDGHTASLFPGISELDEKNNWVVPTLSPNGVSQRLTMTIPYLLKSACTLFLVSGSGKKVALADSTSDDPLAQSPSGMVAHRATNCYWYVDSAAQYDTG